MELWTVEINDFLMSHLEECSIWATYDAGSGYVENYVNLALNNEKALDVAEGPYIFAADFQLAGGLKYEGYIVVSLLGCEFSLICDADHDLDQSQACDPYNVAFWTGKDFCPFNKNLARMSVPAFELKYFNDGMGTQLTAQEIFPVQYKLRLPEDIAKGIKMKTSGTFTLPE